VTIFADQLFTNAPNRSSALGKLSPIRSGARSEVEFYVVLELVEPGVEQEGFQLHASTSKEKLMPVFDSASWRTDDFLVYEPRFSPALKTRPDRKGQYKRACPMRPRTLPLWLVPPLRSTCHSRRKHQDAYKCAIQGPSTPPDQSGLHWLRHADSVVHRLADCNCVRCRHSVCGCEPRALITRSNIQADFGSCRANWEPRMSGFSPQMASGFTRGGLGRRWLL